MAEVDTWRALAAELVAGSPCAVLAVADSWGSSPARRGAVMAVGGAGRLAGTVGGGVAEAALVDRVAAELGTGSLRPGLIRLDHRAGEPGASGLICGGSQAVVLSPVRRGDLGCVAQVVDALALGGCATWSIDPTGWALMEAGGESGEGATGLSLQAGHWVLRHRSGPTHVVHVIGAGHVGAALAPLLMGLEFRVVLVDERAGIDLGPVPSHHRVVVAYEDLAGVIPPGPASFVAIAAHDHPRDAAALAALEGMPLGYLGLLGSRGKVRRLVGDGPAPEWFHGPMGLPIGSTTPAEIAVSVAAEMVAVRSGARGRWLGPAVGPVGCVPG